MLDSAELQESIWFTHRLIIMYIFESKILFVNYQYISICIILWSYKCISYNSNYRNIVNLMGNF